MLKDFCSFGLQHWGSDEKGVQRTRRFLLEWLSFLCRYVPVGLMEVLPQLVNDRPPAYFGRDDLETLMASPQADDWVKISEILLGPVPEGFRFVPKHKANAYNVASYHPSTEELMTMGGDVDMASASVIDACKLDMGLPIVKPWTPEEKVNEEVVVEEGEKRQKVEENSKAYLKNV